MNDPGRDHIALMSMVEPPEQKMSLGVIRMHSAFSKTQHALN